MSKQHARAFVETVNGDPALQQQVRIINDIAGLIAFAERVGFRFTASEWNETPASVASAVCGELTNTQLDQVAAAGITPTPFIGWGSKFLPRVNVINPCI